MRLTLIIFLVTLSLIESASAWGSVGWDEVKAEISKTDPKIVRVIEGNFIVKRIGVGVRLGPQFGERQGERIAPYEFAAVERKTGRKMYLRIVESED